MLRIVVLNPRADPRPLATGLAAMYAARGLRTVLMDFDPQGSSMRWLEKRPPASRGDRRYIATWR
jgi:chromosome partitioning protein